MLQIKMEMEREKEEQQQRKLAQIARMEEERKKAIQNRFESKVKKA